MIHIPSIPRLLYLLPLIILSVFTNLNFSLSAEISHSFIAFGGETFVVDGDGKISWQIPRSSRDGWLLPNGNALLAVSKGKEYPGGAVLEITKEGKTVFEFKGTQSEVNTVMPLDNGNIMFTEAGSPMYRRLPLMEVTMPSGMLMLCNTGPCSICTSMKPT